MGKFPTAEYINIVSENLKACADAGIKFINISPLRSDLMPDLSAEWLPAHPGTDSVMMGIAHTLLSKDCMIRVSRSIYCWIF